MLGSEEKWVEQVVLPSEVDAKQFKEMLSKFKPVGTDSVDKVGRTVVIEHEIHITTRIPKNVNSQRLSPREAEEVKKQLDKLLKARMIKISKSP